MKEFLIAVLLVVGIGTAALAGSAHVCKSCDDCKCKPTCSCPK